jgi:hypothetical protein
MANATTKSQLTPTFNRLNKLRRFLALSLLVTLSFNAFSADNFQQPNKEESNKEEFNKEAYLDLSKPYTHKQSNTTKKDQRQSFAVLSLIKKYQPRKLLALGLDA